MTRPVDSQADRAEEASVAWRESEPEQVTAVVEWVASLFNRAPWDGLAVRGDAAGELLLQVPHVGELRLRVTLLKELRPEVGDFVDALRLRRLRQTALRRIRKRRAPLLWRTLGLPNGVPRGCRDCLRLRYWPKPPPPLSGRLKRVRGNVSRDRFTGGW